MNPTHPRSAAILALVLVAGCGPQAPIDNPTVPSSGVLQPTRGIHLRAAFDDDPTAYVGRFVPNDLAAERVDETSAVQTRCSEHFVHKVVSSNQELDEVVYSSTKVAGSLGVKPFAAITGGSERGATMRVKYTLEKRMQVMVKDPAALERCCASSPEACSKLVIGEFLMGSGEVYQNVGSKDQVEASTAARSVTGEISYKDGHGWKRVNSFKGMYFAFLTTGAALQPAAGAAHDASCNWCENIPPSPDGVYFCGMSPAAPSEAMARDLAMRNAREQAVKLVGEYLSTQASSEASLVKGYLEDRQITSAAASGIAAQVKDTKWCKAETTHTPEGPKYTSKVLAFLSNTDRKQAAVSLLDTMIAAGSKPEGDKPKDAKPKDAKVKKNDDALRKLKDKVK